MLISKQISGLCELFSSKRVCCHCGARQNTEMDLCGTVYRCSNRLRSCGTALLTVPEVNHPIAYLQSRRAMCHDHHRLIGHAPQIL